MKNDIASGVWPPYETFFIESMLTLTDSAITSASRIKSIFSRLRSGPVKVNTYRALNNLQNIIVQSGALSRYFWPSREAYKERGVHLRRSLDVDDHSPLKSRTVRDSIEHFDERLDKYLGSLRASNIMPSYFGRKPTDENTPRHYFRAYFIDTGTFVVLDNEVAITPLVIEVTRIHNILVDCCENGGRLPAT